MPTMPGSVTALLANPNPAVVATVRRDGAAVTAAVWYGWEDGVVTMVTGARSPRRAQLERDGRFSLTVLDAASWYRQVTLHCAVDAVADDEGGVVTDRLSMRYDGRPFGDRAGAHAALRAHVVDWSAFGVG